MEKILNQEFGGERPLYCKKDLYLENVVIRPGESGLKETSNITAASEVWMMAPIDIVILENFFATSFLPAPMLCPIRVVEASSMP